ncbi:MAG: SDR family NAD(P)-dependent oxidoreductase, partial [Planctomycetes bacterium]|nr:SDR family NAD(P)-dependent oxidoreductase [Planctomycetota bacterium]
AVETDVTDFESIKRMFGEASDRFGGLDILVANAGGNFDRNLIEEGDETPAGRLNTK